MTNLCTNCQHCYVPYKYHPSAEPCGGWREYRYEQASCKLVQNMVTGGSDGGRLCSEERNDPKGCGPDAANYLPNPPPPPREERVRAGFWQRLFG